MNEQAEPALNRVELRLMGYRSYSYDEVLIHWLVEDQAYVETGDFVVDIESGKASETLSATEDGIISILLKGQIQAEVPLNAVLATIETPSDAIVIR